MATVRPKVTIFDAKNATNTSGDVVLPHVMASPLRPDLVRYVHTNQSKNFRQPHGVKDEAGYQTSAESWGTGRAVARIPRVSGGGTHRAGQGAFGNMCRGGGMFSPKKVWRRWYRKINLTERRHAVASAVAATTVPGLVMARGHRIEDVREVPIVVSNDVATFKKTSEAVALLNQLGCGADLERCRESKHIRAGRGKMRNRRYVTRRGPLIVYHKSNGFHKAFRAIPGVDLLDVDSFNILKLAPGGTLGRLCVWTESAFKRLDEIFGENATETSELKRYTLPRAVMTNSDLSRIINSSEVQSVLNPAKECPKPQATHKNPLKNKRAMSVLNPAAGSLRKRHRLIAKAGTSENLFFKDKENEKKDDRRNVRDAKRARLTAEDQELQSKIQEILAAREAAAVTADE